MRVSNKMLKNLVAIVSEESGEPIEINSITIGDNRRGYAITAKNGRQLLSDRMYAGEMYCFLQGMKKGIDIKK